MPEDDLSKINTQAQEAAKITFETALRLIEETQIDVDGESIETSLDRSAVKDFPKIGSPKERQL